LHARVPVSPFFTIGLLVITISAVALPLTLIIFAYVTAATPRGDILALWSIAAAFMVLVLYLDISWKLRSVLHANLTNPVATLTTKLAFHRLTYSMFIVSLVITLAIIFGCIGLSGNWDNVSNDRVSNFQNFDSTFVAQEAIWTVGMIYVLWLAWVPFKTQCSQGVRIVYISAVTTKTESPGNSPTHKRPNTAFTFAPNSPKRSTPLLEPRTSDIGQVDQRGIGDNSPIHLHRPSSIDAVTVTSPTVTGSVDSGGFRVSVGNNPEASASDGVTVEENDQLQPPHASTTGTAVTVETVP